MQGLVFYFGRFDEKNHFLLCTGYARFGLLLWSIRREKSLFTLHRICKVWSFTLVDSTRKSVPKVFVTFSEKNWKKLVWWQRNRKESCSLSYSDRSTLTRFHLIGKLHWSGTMGALQFLTDAQCFLCRRWTIYRFQFFLRWFVNLVGGSTFWIETLSRYQFIWLILSALYAQVKD